MEASEFLNHIKRTLDRCMQRWEFDAVVDCKLLVVWVQFANSGDVVAISHDGGWHCEDVIGNYAARIENLLNGLVRDDAGNAVPK